MTQKTSPGGVSITEASWTNDYTPDLGFTITDPDSGNTVKYEVQVDNTDSSFANLILDYTHGSLLASGTTFAFTIGSYGSGSCTGTCPSGLSDSSTGYWWRVRAIDDSAATSGWSTFGVLSTVDYKVDVVAPTGTISINAGATYTNSTSVTLALSGDDTGGSGLSQMRFSNDGSTWPEGWVTYSTSHAWTLAANDGSKTVYAQFMDAAGNTSSLSSAITLRGFGDYANGTTSLSLAQPSGTATGDVLIAYVMDKATSGTTSGPTGWTRAAGAAGTNGRYQAFVAVIGQGGLGSSPWTFTGLTSESAGIIIGYYGVDASTPMDVTGSARYNASGGGTTSITPVTNGNRIVLSHVGLTNNYSWSAMSVANGPTLTEEYDDGDVHSVSIWDATQTTAGATGAASGTGAGGAASVGILLSLRPASGASDSIIYDGTAPTGLTVYDGSSVGVDAAYNDGSLTILHANWTAADFNISGPATPNRYQYAIGTTAGGTNIKTWTSVDTNSATTDSSLSLSTALTYYYTVKATDLAGNVATVSSDGQMVLPVLSVVFTNSPQLNGNANSVDLGIWQSPSYSGTGTTQITTTTNASSGYAVYMYKTADLTLAGGGATVLNISASYSSPILWATACPSGTACFGYTSNDVSVAGSNRYANGANYCAISGTAPGVIVMDDSSPQTSGQSYTVTYKVQTNSLQKAGTYSTGIQYSIVPQY